MASLSFLALLVPDKSPDHISSLGEFTPPHAGRSDAATSTDSLSPATVWSDGDRERHPDRCLVIGAASVIAGFAVAGDVALRRGGKGDACAVITETLNALVSAYLLPGHTLVCCVSLIGRLHAIAPKTISSVTVKRVVVASALLAAKAESDTATRLSYYADATGVSVDILKATEAQLFARLDFDVGTPAIAFHQCLDDITASAAIAELSDSDTAPLDFGPTAPSSPVRATPV